jgi:uncharacterized membrane protein
LKEESFKEIEKELQTIEKQLKEINDHFKLQEGFKFSDFVQEIAGATLMAFPFAANSDVWELSQKMSNFHALLLVLLIVVGLYFVIKYGKIGNWKVQNLGGFVPLRLITILAVSFTVSALALLILGVYPAIVDNKDWFFRAVVLVSLFSVMGSFGLDAAK